MSDVLTLDLRRITGKGITSGSSFQPPALKDMTHRFGFCPPGAGGDSAAAREQQIAALERLIQGLQAREEASAAAELAQQVRGWGQGGVRCMLYLESQTPTLARNGWEGGRLMQVQLLNTAWTILAPF